MGFSRAKASLADGPFPDLRWVSDTGSTNADVQQIMAEASLTDPGRPIDVVLVAEHQRAGRGRLDRTWQAPPAASLLMTLGTTRVVADARRPLLLTVMALAACQACDSLGVTAARIKWPNDLVAGELKFAGILAESNRLPDGRLGAAVGIGINCNWGSMPADLEATATSLDLLCGAGVDREMLAVAVIRGFAERVELLASDEGVETLLADAARRSATLGRDVQVHRREGALEGRAVGLGPDGQLVVRSGDGVRHEVFVGDVVHLRPA